MLDLYKHNPVEVMDRLVRFWNRRAQDSILIRTLTRNPDWDRYLKANGFSTTYRMASPGYALVCFPENPPATETQCLCTQSPQRVMEMVDIQQRVCADLNDDNLPIGYPTMHFGESLFAGIVGAQLRFYGNGLHTWSTAERPPLADWSAMEEVLASPPRDPWRSRFEDMAAFAVKHANGRFGLRTFITIDTLNLAVEWRGSTAAYLDIIDAPEKLERIMSRGVELNAEMLKLERAYYDPYNRRVFQNRAFCALAPALEKPLLSIDAFTLCSPEVYRDFGMPYQQRLIDLHGGGHMHMHGTRLYKFLPLVSRLRGLISIELGDDSLKEGEVPPVKNIRHIREKITGDIPLFVHCTQEEFLEGLQKRSLAGGVQYCVRGVMDPDSANELAARARDYKPPV